MSADACGIFCDACGDEVLPGSLHSSNMSVDAEGLRCGLCNVGNAYDKALMLNDTERDVLARVLDLAADKFSCHGCNDFVLPNTDESAAFMAAIDDANEQSPEDRHRRPATGPIYAQDWVVMRHFADRVRS